MNKTVLETWDFDGGFIYKNGILHEIQDEEGRIIYQNGVYNYEFDYKDHLGNTRVSFKANGQNLEKTAETAFDPWGVRLNIGAVNSYQNRFEMQNHEKESTFGLNRINFGARTGNPITGRFDRIDRFADKYTSLSSYQISANNPTNLIDINGDSLSVAEKYREMMNSVLTTIFGENASKFSYNKNGMLTYSGNNEGFTKDQTAVFDGLSTVMNQKETTNMIFGESTQLTMKDGTTQPIKASDGGGAVTVLASENNVSQNTILIDPKSANNVIKVFAITNAYYLTPVSSENGPRFQQKEVQENLASSTFHEIGHVIFQGKSQNNVLDYQNKARKILKLPPRPYDETHNKTVKKGQYGN